MATIQNQTIKMLKYPANIFGARIQTEGITLDNAQAAHFVIASGEGTQTKVTAQVMSKRLGKDTEPVLVREQEITIGGSVENVIVVAARELAHDEKCSVYLVIPNASAPTITGCIYAVLTNERFNAG